jgi:hypothetical protein
LDAGDFQSGTADGRFKLKGSEIGKIAELMQGLCEKFHKPFWHAPFHSLWPAPSEPKPTRRKIIAAETAEC